MLFTAIGNYQYVGIFFSVVSDLLFDLGYSAGINVLLQYAYLTYLDDTYDNSIYFAQYLFSFLMIISLTFSTQRKESLKLAQSDEMRILKLSNKSGTVHAHVLI